MRKKIVSVVVVALMVCSVCGGACYAVDSFPDSVKGWEVSIAGEFTLLDGETPEEGIPGGPPGTPG
jgi:hypothetical protein